jgi:steroid delta-isomerase-like uncharacterized protein
MTDMPTGERHHEDVIRRMNEELWSEGNLDLIDEVVADEYVEYNTASPEPIRGPEGYKENVEMVRAAFPDMTVTTEELIVDGDTVVNHWTITGTHDGPAMGIEPTGKHVEFSGISIGKFEGGKIVRGETVADMFGLMQQLGVIEPPEQ